MTTSAESEDTAEGRLADGRVQAQDVAGGLSPVLLDGSDGTSRRRRRLVCSFHLHEMHPWVELSGTVDVSEENRGKQKTKRKQQFEQKEIK